MSTNLDKDIKNIFSEGLKELNLSNAQKGALLYPSAKLKSKIQNILQTMTKRRFGKAIRDFIISVPPGELFYVMLSNGYAENLDNEVGNNIFFDSDYLSFQRLKTTGRFEPGKSYRIRFFPALTKVSGEDCIYFLKKHKAIFVEREELLFLQKYRPKRFPKNKEVISFCENENIKSENDDYYVPLIKRGEENDFYFNICDFGHGLDPNDHLLCITEL